jgi:deoxycytidine triphosphate deaminase
VYAEYNKGPITVGAEHNWDEQVGLRQPPTRPWEWEGGNGSPPTNPNYSSDALDMQATLQGFEKFDHKWHQFTTHQSIEKFTTPGNFVRRLKTIQKKTNLRKGRNLNFLGAFDALVSSVSGATGAVQGILNLFGKQSSESLVGQFQDRGFSHFNERTTITVTSGLPTKYYEAFMKDMLKSVVKVPSKHNDAVKQIVRWGLYTGSNTWNAAENVFDIGSGGKVKNFQIFLNRNTACEEMNIVLVKTDVAFKMAEDIFVISKSKSSWGGAFSSTKLHWKKNKAPIKQADLTFVSEYFITLGMNRIKQSREVSGMANTEDGGCGGNAPPKQESPFRL